MTITSQDQFEQAYSEDNGGIPVAFIKLQRLGDSYEVPKIARAWYWWKRSRAAVVVELPPKNPPDHCFLANCDTSAARCDAENDTIDECRAAIEAAGVAVAS